MKTIEKVAREKIKNMILDKANIEFIAENGMINGSLLLSLIKLSKEIVEFAQQWISVNDKLPEANDHSDTIEIKLDNGIVMTGYYFCDGDFLWQNEEGVGTVIKKKVTHWRYVYLK